MIVNNKGLNYASPLTRAFFFSKYIEEYLGEMQQFEKSCKQIMKLRNPEGKLRKG